MVVADAVMTSSSVGRRVPYLRAPNPKVGHDPGLGEAVSGRDPTSRRPAAGARNVGPARSTAAPGSKMTCRSPGYVILAKRKRAPFAAHDESLPIGRGYRSVDRPNQRRPTGSLRVFTVREGGGGGNVRGSQRRDEQSPRKGRRGRPARRVGHFKPFASISRRHGGILVARGTNCPSVVWPDMTPRSNLTPTTRAARPNTAASRVAEDTFLGRNAREHDRSSEASDGDIGALNLRGSPSRA